MSAHAASAPTLPQTPSGTLLSHPPASDSPPASTWSSSTGDDSPSPNTAGPTYRHPSTFSFNPSPSPTKLGATPIDALTRFRMLNITPPSKDPPNHALKTALSSSPELKNAATNTAPIPALTTHSADKTVSTPAIDQNTATSPSTPTAIPSIDRAGIPAPTPQPAAQRLTTPITKLTITPATTPPPADLVSQLTGPLFCTPQATGPAFSEAIDPDMLSSPWGTPGGPGPTGTPEQVTRILKSQLHQTQSAHKSLVGRLRQAEVTIQQLEEEVEEQRTEIIAASELADSLEEEVSLLHARLQEAGEENAELRARLADAEERLSEGGGFKRPGRANEGGNVFASISDFRSLRASLTLKAGSLIAAEQDPTYGPALRVGSSLQQQVDLMQNAMREAAKNKEDKISLERKLRDLEMKSEQRHQSLVAQNRQLKMELQCEKDETSKLRRLLIQTQTDPSASGTAPLGSPSKMARAAAAKSGFTSTPAAGETTGRPEVSKVPDELRREIWRYAKDLEDANRRLVNEKMELEVSWLTAANQLHEVDKQLKSALESKDVLQRALKRLEEKAPLQRPQPSTCSPTDSLDTSLPPLTYSPLTPSLARGLRHTLSALGAAADAVVKVHEDVGLKDQLGASSFRLGAPTGADAKA